MRRQQVTLFPAEIVDFKTACEVVASCCQVGNYDIAATVIVDSSNRLELLEHALLTLEGQGMDSMRSLIERVVSKLRENESTSRGSPFYDYILEVIEQTRPRPDYPK